MFLQTNLYESLKLIVSCPESSWSSSETLKQTFLMPPCSALSGSLSSVPREGGDVSSVDGGSQAPPSVGSVMVDRSLQKENIWFSGTGKQPHK